MSPGRGGRGGRRLASSGRARSAAAAQAFFDGEALIGLRLRRVEADRHLDGGRHGSAIAGGGLELPALHRGLGQIVQLRVARAGQQGDLAGFAVGADHHLEGAGAAHAGAGQLHRVLRRRGLHRGDFGRRRGRRGRGRRLAGATAGGKAGGEQVEYSKITLEEVLVT